MTETLRSSNLTFAARSARGTPPVLQTSTSVDPADKQLSMRVDLATRFGRRSAYDWLLRLDLATSPPVHEQWHGHASSVNGHVEIEVEPKHWPRAGERWLLNLWMRDPNGRTDWDLVDTLVLSPDAPQVF